MKQQPEKREHHSTQSPDKHKTPSSSLVNTSMQSPRALWFRSWFHATRPKTLSAGAVPVVIGSSLAFADGKFVWWVAVLALVCSVLIQIATNFINEIYDFRKGADTAERVGPTRAVASGIISERAMIRASVLVMVSAFLLGQPLVWYGGWEILTIGCISLFFAWAYTGGPFPLAYKGLGDIFVFVFFGCVAVVGTYFVHTHSVTLIAFVLAFGPGALASNILAANNIRDAEQDARVGKRTIAVRMGVGRSRVLFCVMMLLAFVPCVVCALAGYHPIVLLPLLAAFPAARVCVQLYSFHGSGLNQVLAGTAKVLVIHGLLTAVSLVASSLLLAAV